MKKALSFFLAIVLCLSGILPLFVSAEEEPVTDTSAETEIVGTNAVGSLLTEALQRESDEESPYHISTVVLAGNTAEVEFVCDFDGMVMVALYDENDTDTMLAYGKTDFTADEDTVTVTLDTDAMPEWFLLKAFLCDITGSPVGDVFETKEYTEWFYNEFTVKTVNDFDAELVLNLDEDESNNFVVFADGTVIVTAGENNVLQSSEEDRIVITKADDSVKNLKKDDIFYYTYGADESENIIIKVKSVSVNGDTVTVTSADAETEDVFDFVKINTSGDSSDYEIDPENVGEGVTYLGRTENTEEDVGLPGTNVVGMDIDIDNTLVSDSYSINFTWPKGAVDSSDNNLKASASGSGSVNGSLTISIVAHLKIYHAFEYLYVEFCNDYNAGFSISFSGDLSFEIPLSKIPYCIPLCTGVFLSVSPYFTGSFSVELALNGGINKKIGFAFESGKGFRFIQNKGLFYLDLKAEGTVFIGLKVEGVVSSIGAFKKLGSLSLSATFGPEATATPSEISEVSDTVKHDCGSQCLQGDLYLKIQCAASVNLFSLWKRTKILADTRIYFSPFYYSIKHNEFGYGTCPYISHKISFHVVDKCTKEGIPGVKVFNTTDNSKVTDTNGWAYFWLQGGSHIFAFSAKNYCTISKKVITVTEDSSKQFLIILEPSVLFFGSYPQSEVTDETLKNTLTEMAGDTGTWTSYGYYSGTGICYDGNMTASDYMVYKDVVYDKNKYRGVYFTKYRLNYKGYNSETNYSYQDDNGYYVNTIYWFKYDPIEWRVLDPTTGLVMSETILDAQAYNNYILYENVPDPYYWPTYWGNSSKTYYANNYEYSSIRAWLNEDFYNTAFSTEQQKAIATTTLDNSAYSTSYSAYSANSTKDKIFILSYSEAHNTSYFANNTSRQAIGSAYAKSQGLYISIINKCSYWRLRSAGIYSNLTCNVFESGDAWGGYDTDDMYYGVRPAMRLNLSTVLRYDNRYTEDVGEGNFAGEAGAGYMAYILADNENEDEDLFTNENVLYADFLVADENGNIAVPTDTYSGTLVVRCMKHSGEWKTETEATGENPVGIKSFTCSVCGLTVRAAYDYTSATISYGDVNEDGEITAADARLALRASVKLDTLTDAQTKAADVDGKDGVTAADARLILRYSVKLESKFPVEQ